ncbi:hypothetical protein Tco_0496568 [Tanacetum coccineum]
MTCYQKAKKLNVMMNVTEDNLNAIEEVHRNSQQVTEKGVKGTRRSTAPDVVHYLDVDDIGLEDLQLRDQ